MASARATASLRTAFGDLACALLVFACGLFGAPLWLTGLAGAGMVAYWTASRWRVLKRLPARVWARLAALALSVIIAIEAGAYWLGLGLGGNI